MAVAPLWHSFVCSDLSFDEHDSGVAPPPAGVPFNRCLGSQVPFQDNSEANQPSGASTSKLG